MIEHEPHRCVLELTQDGETRAQYPFAFTLRVSFELGSDGALEETIEVHNPAQEPLFGDVGFYPGFVWPLEPGRAKEDHVVVFGATEPAPIRRGSGDPSTAEFRGDIADKPGIGRVDGGTRRAWRMRVQAVEEVQLP